MLKQATSKANNDKQNKIQQQQHNLKSALKNILKKLYNITS
jgi:hypothetical protein